MRKLLMVLRVSVQSLIAHKMRSFLTMLGVVIGVGAVIALVAVGQGAQAQVVNQFQSLGSNLLTVVAQARTSASRAQGLAAERQRQLTDADVNAIQGLATAVARVAPEYSANSATVSYAGQTTSPSITGVTADYAPVRNWTVDARALHHPGGQRQPGDGRSAWANRPSKTCSAARSVNPVGETIRINRQNYEVIGVLKSKGDERPAATRTTSSSCPAHGAAQAGRRGHQHGPHASTCR